MLVISNHVLTLTEFAGTLLGFDDYVSKLLLFSYQISNDQILT